MATQPQQEGCVFHVSHAERCAVGVSRPSCSTSYNQCEAFLGTTAWSERLIKSPDGSWVSIGKYNYIIVRPKANWAGLICRIYQHCATASDCQTWIGQIPVQAIGGYWGKDFEKRSFWDERWDWKKKKKKKTGLLLMLLNQRKQLQSVGYFLNVTSLSNNCPANWTRSSATAEIARDTERPFIVTEGHPLLCQSTRHIWLPVSTQ